MQCILKCNALKNVTRFKIMKIYISFQTFRIFMSDSIDISLQ